MVNKGSFSFVAMLVINPIVILFYQNCSMAPVSYAKNTTQKPAVTRQVASDSKASVATVKSSCTEQDEKCTDRK